MFIETHTHLHHKKFNKDRDEVITQMDQQNVRRFLEVSIDFESNFVMRESLKDIPGVKFTTGIHPMYVWKTEENPEYLIEHITRFARMQDTVAIGEVGLDHHIPETEEFWGLQEEWFHNFIQLSQVEQLPMVLHIRQAHEDGIRVLKEHGNYHRGVVHCFEGSWKEAKEYIDMGLSLGIGGFVTMEKPGMEEAVRKLPLEAILLETDSPFVTPRPLTGRNTPANIPLIAQKLADIRGISVEEVEIATTQNAMKLFGF